MNITEKSGKRAKNDVLFIITTYNRPESLLYLLDSIYGLGDILVFDDCSDLNYYGIEKYGGLFYLKSKSNAGINGYYTIINYLFNWIKKAEHYKYYIFCPDDFIPVENFLDIAIDIYESIDDSSKICLNLYTDRGRFMRQSWTDILPVILKDYLKTGWVDMCFLCEYKLFEALNWQIKAPGEYVFSSGVGRDMSKRLILTHTIYQVKFSLFKCQVEGKKSKMYGYERHMNFNTEILPNNAYQNVDFSMVCVASTPERIEMLEKTVKSLYNQCDVMRIMLNGYDQVPEFLKKSKIETIISDNRYGDAGKFYGMDSNFKGYYFSCDDDIIYPDDYISRTIKKIDFYGLNCLITYHGSLMKPKPVHSYYRWQKEKFNLFYDRPYDIRVDVPGSGVSAWHISMFKFDYKRCIWPNMADIWLAKFANEQNVPCILVEHIGNDFKYQESHNNIYARHRYNDEIQTQLYNNL